MRKKQNANEIYKMIMKIEFKELPNGKIHKNGLKEREKPCNMQRSAQEDLCEILLYIGDRATRMILRKCDKSCLPEILDMVFEAFYEKDALIFFRYGKDSVDAGRLNAFIDRVTRYKIADYYHQYGIKKYIGEEEALDYDKDDIHYESDGRMYVFAQTNKKTEPIDGFEEIRNNRIEYEPEQSLEETEKIIELLQVVMQTEGSLGVKIMYLVNLLNKGVEYKSSCKDLTSTYNVHELEDQPYGYIREYLADAIGESFNINFDTIQMTTMLNELDKQIYTFKGKTYVADHHFHLPKEVTIKSELSRFEKKVKVNILEHNNNPT